jgi:uncharacterized membrane protein
LAVSDKTHERILMTIFFVSLVINLTQDERLQMQETRNALKTQISNIRLERYHFDQIVAEGVRAASDWKRTVDK